MMNTLSLDNATSLRVKLKSGTKKLKPKKNINKRHSQKRHTKLEMQTIWGLSVVSGVNFVVS